MSGGFVVAVCTNRTADLRTRWEHNAALLGPGEFLVLFDAEADAGTSALLDRIRAGGGEVLVHGRTRGVSAARNSVLDALPKRHILFVDDDVLLDGHAVAAARAAFAGGAHVVGARLVPPPRASPWPWFFSAGQAHLVGWHAPGMPVTTWGAFMGVDAGFAVRHGLRFDERLGRLGAQLRSGDDTSFVAAMKAAGAVECLLPEVRVVHDAAPDRLTLRYLVRRSFWQGRSEMLRGSPVSGLRKEWRRHRSGTRGGLLPLLYTGATAAGVAREAWQWRNPH